MFQDISPVNLILILYIGWFSWRGFKSNRFQDQFMFIPFFILVRKDYKRMVTSAFLHADWTHYIFNAFTMFMFGTLIEQRVGPVPLLLVFFSSVIGGNALSLYLHRNHDYRALGASGGACGLIFAAVHFFPGIEIGLFIHIPGWIYALLFVGFSVYGIRHSWGNIGHDAHLGGAIIGLIVATIIAPENVSIQPVLWLAMMGLSGAALYYLVKNPLFLPFKQVWNVPFDTQKRERKQTVHDSRRMDELLDKISREGIQSLSAAEKRFLKKASERKGRG